VRNLGVYLKSAPRRTPYFMFYVYKLWEPVRCHYATYY